MKKVPRGFHTFDELIASEHQQLEEALESDPKKRAALSPKIAYDGPSNEPWVAWTNHDRVGLALSGGGIRSATFNLGLLEALEQRGVLKRIDYLSTVSGGGYIGGFWTAWRQRNPAKHPLFPQRIPPGTQKEGEDVRDERERPEIRHLREFSRFLMPRIGVNDSEMWAAAAAVLGGMLPALVATFAMIALIIYFWLGIGYLATRPLNNWDHFGAMAVFAVLTLSFHTMRHRNLLAKRRCELAGMDLTKWTVWYFALALITTVPGCWLVAVLRVHQDQWRWGWHELSPKKWMFETWTFEPALAWLALAGLVALGGIFCEVLISLVRVAGGGQDRMALEESRKRRLRRSALSEQLAGRYLSWGVIAAALGGLWELSFWLDRNAGKGIAVGATGGITAVFTTVFIWLREWLTRSDKLEQGVGFMQKLKSRIPTIAASGGALSLIISTVLMLRYLGLGDEPALGILRKLTDLFELNPDKKYLFLIPPFIVMSIVFMAFKVFDPSHFGLHDFYRGRIARAFLGAAFKPGPFWNGRENIKDTLANLHRESELRDKHGRDARKMAGAPNLEERESKQLLLQGAAESKLAAALEDLHTRLQKRQSAEPGPGDNRFTLERPEDDICLTDLPATRSELPDPENAAIRLRPIHLICCTANHLTGDALPNLSRGARSVVLSQRGITLGDETCEPRSTDPRLMLSAAQTASGAAFNSQMGEKSIRLGPAGAFLMSALNLRLGLWVRNPASVRAAHDRLLRGTLAGKPADEQGMRPWRRKLFYDRSPRLRWLARFPGKAFFRELFGMSRCLPDDSWSQLHLSDGGHFENLGLYELVRRHCRYIIVSDAGQDEDIAFDDLGNAIRRVREDFGVEIEIDLAPIRPNSQLISQQHLVVGTVHYDGFEGSDKGALIYLKPTITGDEPGDIQQYRRRNRDFPHEPTSDQFFAEAQWESYRRLGEHCGLSTFFFLDQLNPTQREQTETIFWNARATWTPLPPGFDDTFRELSAHVRELDADMRDKAPAALRAEFFPEVAEMQVKAAAATPTGGTPVDAEVTQLYFLMRAIQLMEDAWIGLKLRTLWAHPVNEGWMNYFHRWAAMPSFRRWWPLLRPLYSMDFRYFIRSRFEIGVVDPLVRSDDVGKPGPEMELHKISQGADREGYAWKAYHDRRGALACDLCVKLCAEGMVVFDYRMSMSFADDEAHQKLQVGFAVVKIEKKNEGGVERKIASWDSNLFYVPEPLFGSGIVGRFLERLIKELHETEQVEEIRVTVHDEVGGRDPASRQLRLRLLDFYKSREFRLYEAAAPGTPADMRRRLDN